jgi:retron-type reverse transcriptase
MAKTFTHLFESIVDFGNLHAAYLKARRGKRYAADVLRFGANLEEELLALRAELQQGVYQTGRYNVFTVYEPKERQIAALPFRDRVVHHALCRVIEPIWEARFMRDSYACRVGKGTHAGADRLTQFLQRAARRWDDEVYVLKMDVRSYFPSVNHAILLSLLRRHIACDRTLGLITEIIESWPVAGGEFGLPIGNLTSQLCANVYLHELDVFVKQQLRVEMYVRYMDDAVVVDRDKHALQATRVRIAQFLAERLMLQLNSKTQVFAAAQGVSFLGYRLWATHRLLREGSIRRMRRKIRAFRWRLIHGELVFKEMDASVQSWLGHARHANTYRLRRRVLSGSGDRAVGGVASACGPHAAAA